MTSNVINTQYCFLNNNGDREFKYHQGGYVIITYIFSLTFCSLHQTVVFAFVELQLCRTKNRVEDSAVLKQYHRSKVLKVSFFQKCDCTKMIVLSFSSSQQPTIYQQSYYIVVSAS